MEIDLRGAPSTATLPLGSKLDLLRLTGEIPGLLYTLLFFAVHVAVGIAGLQSTTLTTLHALLTFVLGIFWAVQGRLLHVACIAGYIIGAEVFWRMGEANVPWEFGKYALSFILIVALIGKRKIFGPRLILIYFVLLLPSTWLTWMAVEPGLSRQFISFNLSGPFALLVSAWFFSHLRIHLWDLLHIMVACVGAAITALSAAIFNVFTQDAIEFATESNFATSGGFGPNQVSPILGLGAVLLFFVAAMGRGKTWHKVLLLIPMFAFVAQSALTFSRSGPAMAIGSVAIGSLFLFKSTQARLAIASIGAVLLLVLTFIVVPAYDEFTRGAFSERITSTTSTNRLDIAGTDIHIWGDHPVLGVGPGIASYYRRDYGAGGRVAAHTEFTRMLSEHGTFGLISLTFLLAACLANFFLARDYRARAIAAAFITWGLLFMLVNAFRLAAPAFLLAVPFARLWLNDRWTAHLRFEPLPTATP